MHGGFAAPRAAIRLLRNDAGAVASHRPRARLLLAPEAASAFDCAKAKSADEKAICASPEAKAADDAMAAAYLALRKTAAGADRNALDAAQTRWLGRRSQNCSDDDGNAFHRSKTLACFAVASSARAAFLTGAPEAGPGAPTPMAPTFRIEKGRKGHADVDFQLVKFVQPASPGERAFNAAADKLYRGHRAARRGRRQFRHLRLPDRAHHFLRL